MFDTPEENRAEVDAILDSGATIMGRNMFGPGPRRVGPRLEGLVGTEPAVSRSRSSYSPTTRTTRSTMEGGTTFHFVTDGIHSALDRARAAAGDRRHLGRRRSHARSINSSPPDCIDELRLHVTACIVGAGERVFDGVPPQQFERVSVRAASLVTHVTYAPIR